MLFRSGGGGGTGLVAPNNIYGGINSPTNPPPIMISSTYVTGSFPFDFVLESNVIYVALNGNAYVWVHGWEDSF